MIKRSLVLAAGILALTLTASAQTESVQALIPSGEYEWGLSIRPEMKVTQLGSDNKVAGLAGLQIGPALNRTFYICAAGYALINNLNAGSSGYENLSPFDFWYAGGALDFTILHTKLAHVSIGCFAGGGQIRVTPIKGDQDSANLFVAEPNLNLEINVTTSIEFGLGAGYRFVRGSDFNQFADEDLSNWTGTGFLRWTEIW